MMNKLGIVASAMRYRKIIILITGILLLFGIYGLYNMSKQEFPVYTIRQGIIVGVYPGATAKQVDEQLTKPLENFIFTYKEINRKKTYSQSKDGVVYTYVTLNDNINNKDEVWSKLRHGLIDFKEELPLGVLGLMVDDDFGQTSATLITLESETKTYRQLESYLEKLENRLRKIEKVANLHRYGTQKEQISVYLNKDKMAAYGINTTTIGQSLFMHGLISSSGNIKSEEIETPVHITKTYQTEKDLEEQIVYSDPQGNIIHLKDIARVVREYPEPESYITNNGKKALLLSVEMREGNDITSYGEDVDKEIKKFESSLPDDIKVYRVADQAKVVEESVDTFLWEMLIAIASVILVTMLLMPFRVASVAAASIPITIFISLGIMYAVGIELNTVTLAALIVVLGLIVDDCIVIVDGYIEKIDHGMSRWHASISSATSYFKSLVTATLTISVTFFPLLFTFTGELNDFIKSFPWTITITLFVSLGVAMFIIPFMQYVFIKKGLAHAHQTNKSKSFLEKLQFVYDRLLPKLFKRPALVMGAGALSVILAAFIFMNVRQRLMPVAERNQFVVEFYLPQGSPLKRTASVCDSMEHILRRDKRTVSVASFIGTSSPRFHSSYAPKIPAKNYGQFIVNTVSNEATEEMLDEYADTYAQHFPNAYVRFKQIDNQDAAVEIEARISGEDFALVKQFSDSLMAKLKEVKETSWIRTDLEGTLPYVDINMNAVQSNRLGINETTLAMELATRLDGTNITTLWENDYALNVKLKPEWQNKKVTASNIENEYIPTITGVSVPLKQIATVSPNWEHGQIVRRNGTRTLSVLADLKRGENAGEVFPKVEKIVETLLKEKTFSGVNVSYGGVAESDAKTIPEIINGLIIALLIIFFVLIYHYKKISLTLLTLASISLCFFGAGLGIWLLDMEFSITAVLGIVCLFGIVVRNAVILFDYAESLRVTGKMTVRNAAIEAGKRRMRPIFLTSAAASMGVIPMIISQSPLWSPMGTVICFGTFFSMLFITTILPVAYWLVFRSEKTKKI
ncbi:efflux RND transporter permease subunit [Bacteroides ihuae]|uniref:efflux RND transporter permease subunit n=1 Tax=Bacteroides ihuae TaxID=1852362 RepID=UPI0008DAE43B|nr:efflux RND transporter permease subunit [Bacteroides ihuae]